MTYYCSHCGAKVFYETVKPSKCPKCTKPMKDSLLILNQSIRAAAPIVEEESYDGDMDEGLNPGVVNAAESNLSSPFAPVRSERSRPVVQKDRRALARQRLSQSLAAENDDDDFAPESGGNDYNKAQASMLARQWAEAFDPDGIEIAPKVGNEVVKFGTLWQQGQAAAGAAQNQGGQS